MRPSLLLCAVLAVAPAVALRAAEPAPCPASDPLLKELVCAANEHGWFYAPERAEADMAADAARAAAAGFEREFARKPAFGAVVIVDYSNQGPAASDAAEAALRQAGAGWVLNWVSAASISREMQRQLRKQLKGRSTGSKVLAAPPGFAKQLAARASGTLRHEIGHKLLVAAYWPQASFVHDRAHYGGPAPDWLDEGAAMLMEPAAEAEHRRELFADMAAGRLKGAPMQALPAFLAALHPRLADPDLPDEIKTPGENRVSISYGLDASSNGAFLRMGGYYAQSLVWVDFLKQAGKPGTLDAIASALAQGRSFEQWLGQDGVRYGLAADVPALDRQWTQWRQQRYPGPDAPR